ncbi:MAG: PQQ-dependent sugar dehydrogenase [Burkholderiales bacterium]
MAPQLFAGGFGAPIEIVGTGQGPGQVYVVEQPGLIRIVRGGVASSAPLLDIRALVSYGGERGLLGLALHPRFADNGRFFVNYTRAGDGATVVASFTVNPANRDVADPSSRREILVVPQPFENHNGGALRFGPDGYLYVGMGDGGSGNDPANRAQDPQDLLGKILRIDVDGAAPYAIPQGNAFASTAAGRPEIWALGVRNPWRFSFDRATGDLYLGDVGQSAVEEIDFAARGSPSGLNFGWRVMEGNRCTGLGGGAACGSDGFTPPVASYDHGQGCSVTGGVVYRGSAVPVMQGRYVYGDFCTGRIWALNRDRGLEWQSEVLLDTGHQIATFGEDSAGEVYWSDLRSGNIYRLAAQPAAPVAIEYFNGALAHYFVTAFPEEAAALDAGALGGAWRRTGFAFPVAAAGDPGSDVCRLFGTAGVGPNTHFYTGNAQECADLRANPRWTFEAIAFRMWLPVNDACPPGTRPVYRLYNNPATLAAVNHRFTTDGPTYEAMRAQGWIGEGVAFCAPG